MNFTTLMIIFPFTGYADDNTPFVVKDYRADVISAIKEEGKKHLIWFFDNQMNLNTNNCHLLFNTHKQNILNI